MLDTNSKENAGQAVEAGQKSVLGGARTTGTWVVVALLLASAAMGTVAFFRYKRAESVLSNQMRQLSVAGENLAVNECVDAVLDNYTHCEVMRSLCDAEVPRMMDACLGARSRVEYCTSVAESRRSTGFGYEKCREKGLKRREMKACAAVFRAIDKYCERTDAPKS